MMQELDDRVVDRCQLEYKNESKLVLNSPMLKGMARLYTRHTFEHMLFQYMHSHYLSVESKESDDASEGFKIGLGHRSLKNTVVGSKLKPGIYNVSDPQEKQIFQVQVRCKLAFFFYFWAVKFIHDGGGDL